MALLMTDPRRTPFDDLDPAAVLTAAEVAARIRVEAHSVRRAFRRGELPASRTCGVRVLAADAVAWWRPRAVRPVVPPERPKPAAAPARRFVRGTQLELPLPPRGGGA